MSIDDASRRKFVKTMTDFCVTHSFDGVDYDWEFPKTAQEKKGYIDLIRDTKQAFSPRGKIVTVALGHQQNLGKEAYGLLDRVHIMSYDHPGKHSTLEHAKGDAARFMGFGVAKGKLLLGVPFYARNVKKPNDSRSYGDLAEAHDLEPGSDWAGDYYFNGINTVKKKAAHAQELGLGGIMVEIMKDVSFRVLPITRTTARKMIEQTQSFPILNGARGNPPLDHKSIRKAPKLRIKCIWNRVNIRPICVNTLL